METEHLVSMETIYIMSMVTLIIINMCFWGYAIACRVSTITSEDICRSWVLTALWVAFAQLVGAFIMVVSY